MMAAERISLERIVFINAIDVPGREKNQYPSKESRLVATVTPDNRLSSSKHFNIWFEPATGFVVVEHPDSGAQEEVPLHNVQQWRRVKIPASASTKK